MKNSLERFNAIIQGPIGGTVCDMYDRLALPESGLVVERAYQVRQFFSAGWLRLFLKDPLNRKGNARDAVAFAELRHVEGYQSERASMMKRKSGANSRN